MEQQTQHTQHEPARREHTRFPLEITTRVFWADTTQPSKTGRQAEAGGHDDPFDVVLTRDVSAGGAFLKLPVEVPVGAKLRLEMRTPSRTRPRLPYLPKWLQITATATVVRRNEQGVAVAYDAKPELAGCR